MCDGLPRVMGLEGANGADPDSELDLSVHGLILRDAENRTRSLYGPSPVTCDIGVQGPNGRDQVTAFDDEWVNFYFIYSPSVGLASIASLSPPPTGPTLPAGYTYWAYATSVRVDASGNLYKVYISGNRVAYDDPHRTINPGSATTFTDIDLTAWVPPISNIARLSTYLQPQISTGAPATIYSFFRPDGSTNATGLATNGTTVQGNNVTVTDTCISDWYVGPTQTVEYRLDTAVASGGLYMDVVGYQVPNGDS